MYRGISALNLDDKGRLALPTRYREDFAENSDNTVVLTIDIEDSCLLLYPLPEWELIEGKLESLPSFNPVARRVQRLLLGHAVELVLDGHGRILVPQPLREYAALQKQVVLVGQGKKFELWDAAVWELRRQEWLQAGTSGIDELPVELQNLSL